MENTAKVIERSRSYARMLSTILEHEKVKSRIAMAGIGARHVSFSVQLYNSAHLRKVAGLGERFALATRTKQCITTVDSGLIYFQVQLPKTYCEDITRDEIVKRNLPTNTVALAEGWSGVQYEFNSYAPHGLFAGTTGSGKTEAMRSTIVGLAQTYKPDELSLLIVDGKKIDYSAKFNNLAHLVMPIAKDFNAYAKVIEYAYTEMKQRYRIMSDDPNYKPRRLVLVIDEAHDSEIIGIKANYDAIKDIAKMGRSANVNLIIGTQKPSQDELPKIVDLLLNRFVGLVDNSRTSYELTGKKQLGAHLLSGEGDMLHVIGPNIQRCQICMATQADYDRLPRADVIEPKIIDSEIRLPDEIIPTEKKQGRPQNEITPRILAYYAYHHPTTPKVRQAQSDGISYDNHKMHIGFWMEFIRELKQLKSTGGKLLC